MNNDAIRETLSFKDLTPEEKERKGILGRLYGPCADILHATRNGRFYPIKCWKNAFKNEFVQEMLKNGGIPGELNHPADRDDIDPDRIAISMPEEPKEGPDGKLIAYFDILDLPCGRIVYQLAKYGYKLGISSRGNGETYTDSEGNEIVDPDTYEFKCFDIVLIPSVKEARLTMTEGLDTKKSLKVALNEELKRATADDRKKMTDVLDSLDIDYKQSEEVVDNKEEKVDAEKDEKHDEAVNDGSEELITSLQEALKDKTRLEAEVKSLQEQLAVSNTKAEKLEESINRYKDATTRLSTLARKGKVLSKEVSSLKEQLQQKDAEMASKIKTLKESKQSDNSLNEALSKKDATIKQLQENVNTLKAQYEKEIQSLKEGYEKNSKDIQVKLNESVTKINKLTTIKESYKKLALETVDRYIDSKAVMFGITSNEIKNKLPKSYTLNDIDRICEGLQQYSLNMSRLPFNLKSSKVIVNESINDNLNVNENKNDIVDEALLQLAGLDK